MAIYWICEKIFILVNATVGVPANNIAPTIVKLDSVFR